MALCYAIWRDINRMKLSEVGGCDSFVRMGHSHGHHDNHHDPVLERCRELMHEDHRAVFAKVDVAVAKVALPIWRMLAEFGIYRR